MLHTNCGELALLFDTFCRIWRAGGQATLTTSTKDGQVQANLELQLGLPAAARAGAPSPQQRLSSPSSAPGHPGATRRQPCHRGPAAKAKSRARAALHQAAKAAALSDSEGAPPSSPVAASLDTPEGASPSHPEGASPFSAEPTPASGGALPSHPTDPVEESPNLPTQKDTSSPAPGDFSSPAPGAAPPPDSGEKSSPDPGNNSPPDSGDVPLLAPKPYPAPGDASKFLSATRLFQCDALLPRAQPCEKIFSNEDDFEAHGKSVHGITGCWNFCTWLNIDCYNNIYIL